MCRTCLVTRIGCWLFGIPLIAGTAFAQVSIVKDGEVRAVVVTAAKPSRVAAYAVEELVNHIEKATGKRLPVAVESAIPAGVAGRIFVGVTQAALQQGIAPDRMEPEEFVLRTVGNDLYVVGKELPPVQEQPDPEVSPKDDRDNPLSLCCEMSGTLFGVYEILNRYVGVRWLWPGELGTYVPRSDTIEVPAVNEAVKPQLIVRWLGTWWVREMGWTGSWCGSRRKPIYAEPLTEDIMRRLVFPSEDAAYEYGRATEVFNRRHRMVLPVSTPVRVAEAASHIMGGVPDWWAAYGKEHPEWFAMRADGGRGRKQPRAGNWTAMCVSNPELQRFIVEQAWDGRSVIQLGEADVIGENFCQCPNCLAWDGPQPTDFPEIMRPNYTPRAVGDRYARFYKAIYDLASKRNPNVQIAAMLYHNTLPAPLTDIKLTNVTGTMVIYGSWDGWYPMSKEEDQWYRDQWLGWARAGMKLVNKSNYLLNNYTTSYVVTRQSGDFLKFLYEHDMVGMSMMSSSNFAWSAQGVMAYMYHRWLDHPEMQIEDIRQEYFSAFGAAAPYVEQYFDYWENYARTRSPISSVATGDRYGALEKLRRSRGHYLAYPPEVYRPAEELLEKALEAARKDPLPEFAERVKFLQAGVRHALLSTGIQKYLDFAGPAVEVGSAPTDNPARLKQAKQAMWELIEFRRDPENLFVGSYMMNAYWERYHIQNIEALFETPADAAPAKQEVRDDIF